VAVGTNTDSITFTSNSLAPTAGSWVGIYLNGGNDSSSIFNYCNFRYANTAIRNNQGVMDVLTIKNSCFSFNMTGLKDNGRIMRIDSCNFKYNNYGLFDIVNSTISNCTISKNQIGFDSNNPCSGCGNTINECIVDSNQIGLRGLIPYTAINNCKIRYNHYGVIFNYSKNISLKGSQVDSNTVAGITIGAGDISIDSCQIRYNSVGIIDSGGTSQNIITRNVIEYNFLGIKLGTANDDIHCNKICNNTSYDLKSMTSNKINIPNNYWCTQDSASIQTIIFDGQDSINLGLVNFMPPDTMECYSCSQILIGYTATPADFPQQNGTATVYPTNGHPPYTYSWSTSPIQNTQTAKGLGVGDYTICVTDSMGMGCADCIVISIFDSNALYVNEVFPDNSFSFFPNPASNHLIVALKTNTPETEIKIFNITGELEYSSTTTECQVDIDVSNLASGVHIIQIATGDKLSRQKLIKK
jgi:hypothetical protein